MHKTWTAMADRVAHFYLDWLPVFDHRSSWSLENDRGRGLSSAWGHLLKVIRL